MSHETNAQHIHRTHFSETTQQRLRAHRAALVSALDSGLVSGLNSAAFSERPRSIDFARIEPQRHAPVCVEEDKGVEREVRLRFAIR
jgi:hypothetical protein